MCLIISCHMIVDENSLPISTTFLSFRIRCMLFYLKCWLHVCLINVSFEDFEWKGSPSREWKQNRLRNHLSFFFHHFLSSNDFFIENIYLISRSFFPAFSKKILIYNWAITEYAVLWSLFTYIISKNYFSTKKRKKSVILDLFYFPLKWPIISLDL